MSTFLELYQRDRKVKLTPEEIKRFEDMNAFRFKKALKFCDICDCELSPEERSTVNIFHKWKTCHKHRHLSNIEMPDMYLEKYGTFDLTPEYEKQLEEAEKFLKQYNASQNVNQPPKRFSFINRLKNLFRSPYDASNA